MQLDMIQKNPPAWSESEDMILKDCTGDFKRACAELPHRTKSAIRRRASLIGVPFSEAGKPGSNKTKVAGPGVLPGEVRKTLRQILAEHGPPAIIAGLNDPDTRTATLEQLLKYGVGPEPNGENTGAVTIRVEFGNDPAA